MSRKGNHVMQAMNWNMCSFDLLVGAPEVWMVLPAGIATSSSGWSSEEGRALLVPCLFVLCSCDAIYGLRFRATCRKDYSGGIGWDVEALPVNFVDMARRMDVSRFGAPASWQINDQHVMVNSSNGNHVRCLRRDD